MVDRYPTNKRKPASGHSNLPDLPVIQDPNSPEREEALKRAMGILPIGRADKMGKIIKELEESRVRAVERSDRSMPGVDPDLPYIFEPFLPPLQLPGSPFQVPGTGTGELSPSLSDLEDGHPTHGWYFALGSNGNVYSTKNFLGDRYASNGFRQWFPATWEPTYSTWQVAGYDQDPTLWYGLPSYPPSIDDALSNPNLQQFSLIETIDGTFDSFGGPREYIKLYAHADVSDDQLIVPGTSQPSYFEVPLFPKPNSWADAVAKPGTQPSNQEPSRDKSRDDQRARYDAPLVPYLRWYTIPSVGVVPDLPTQVITVPEVGAAPKVETAPAPDTISKPITSTQTKERKLRITGAAAGAWHVINFLTEVNDFLEVLHEALPTRCRAKGRNPSPFAMSEAIYNCFEHLDLSKAVENYVNNWIEDMFYSLQGRAGARLNNVSGNFTGGSNALRGGSRNAPEGFQQDLRPPEVHFDTSTGEWSVDTPFGSIHGRVSR